MTHFQNPVDLRAACRSGAYDGPTSGHAKGYIQANMVILPASEAEDFKKFANVIPSLVPYWRFSIQVIRSRDIALRVPIFAPTSLAIEFSERAYLKEMSPIFLTFGKTVS